MFIHPTFVTEAGYGEMTINQPFRKCSGLRKLKNDTYTSTMVKATNSVNVPSRTQNKCLAACTTDFFVREK